MATIEAIRAGQRELHRRHEGEKVVNVGEAERLASEVGGAVLVLGGLMRGGLPGLAMVALGGGLAYRGFTGHCSLYQALGADSAAGDERGPRDSVPAKRGVHFEEAITINRSAEEVYRFWRDPTNHPKFTEHLESVTTVGENRTHWVMGGPLGLTLEWDAETYEDRPDELIAWRSLEGSQVDVAGSVHFRPAPGGRGTEARVVQKINPPGGALAAAVAGLFGKSPEQQMRGNLRRLKQLLETGEIATVEGQTSGRA